MGYQAIPHNAELLIKAKDGAISAGSLLLIDELSPEGMKVFEGLDLKQETINLADDISRLLNTAPDLTERYMESWDGWSYLHALYFDFYDFIKHESPETIVTALYGQTQVHPDYWSVRYTPPDEIPQLVEYLSQPSEKKLWRWFPTLRKKQIRPHPMLTYKIAIKGLQKSMQVLHGFYVKVMEKGNEGVVVDVS